MSLPRLFVLGDSISMHYGPHLQQMLHGQFEYARKGSGTGKMNDIETPTTTNGGDSSVCLAYLQEQMNAGGLPADVLLLNCGLHDVKSNPATGAKQVPLDAYEKNLRAIITLVKNTDIALVWVRTTPVYEANHNGPNHAFWRLQADVDSYNAAADAIMTEAAIPMIDLHALTLVLAPMDQQCPDGRHFVETTRQAQASYIAGWLTAWLQFAGAAGGWG